MKFFWNSARLAAAGLLFLLAAGSISAGEPGDVRVKLRMVEVPFDQLIRGIAQSAEADVRMPPGDAGTLLPLSSTVVKLSLEPCLHESPERGDPPRMHDWKSIRERRRVAETRAARRCGWVGRSIKQVGKGRRRERIRTYSLSMTRPMEVRKVLDAAGALEGLACRVRKGQLVMVHWSELPFDPRAAARMAGLAGEIRPSPSLAASVKRLFEQDFLRCALYRDDLMAAGRISRRAHDKNRGRRLFVDHRVEPDFDASLRWDKRELNEFLLRDCLSALVGHKQGDASRAWLLCLAARAIAGTRRHRDVPALAGMIFSAVREADQIVNSPEGKRSLAQLNKMLRPHVLGLSEQRLPNERVLYDISSHGAYYLAGSVARDRKTALDWTRRAALTHMLYELCGEFASGYLNIVAGARKPGEAASHPAEAVAAARELVAACKSRFEHYDKMRMKLPEHWRCPHCGATSRSYHFPTASDSAHFLLGRALMRAARYREAAKCFRTAIKLAPSRAGQTADFPYPGSDPHYGGSSGGARFVSMLVMQCESKAGLDKAPGAADARIAALKKQVRRAPNNQLYQRSLFDALRTSGGEKAVARYMVEQIKGNPGSRPYMLIRYVRRRKDIGKFLRLCDSFAADNEDAREALAGVRKVYWKKLKPEDRVPARPAPPDPDKPSLEFLSPVLQAGSLHQPVRFRIRLKTGRKALPANVRIVGALTCGRAAPRKFEASPSPGGYHVATFAPCAPGTKAAELLSVHYAVRATSGGKVLAEREGFIPVVNLSYGLAASWKLAGENGSRAEDSSGRGNHGQVQKGARWSASGGTKSLLLDGKDGCIKVPAGPRLRFTGALTLAARIRLDRLDNGQGTRKRQAILCKYSATGRKRAFEFGFNDMQKGKGGAPGRLFFTVSKLGPGFVGGHLVGKTKLAARKWYHVAAVYKPRRIMALFVDGRREDAKLAMGRVPEKIATNDLPLLLGMDYDTQGAFCGHMRDVRIYDRALAEVEIKALAGRH